MKILILGLAAISLAHILPSPAHAISINSQQSKILKAYGVASLASLALSESRSSQIQDAIQAMLTWIQGEDASYASWLEAKEKTLANLEPMSYEEKSAGAQIALCFLILCPPEATSDEKNAIFKTWIPIHGPTEILFLGLAEHYPHEIEDLDQAQLSQFLVSYGLN